MSLSAEGRAHRAHLCSSGSPDPDLFVIRRSQTTERGERKKRLLFASGPNGPKMPPCNDGQRGGLSPALRKITPPPHRRARACPSPSLAHAQSNARGGNPLGCACGIRGPRATGKSRPGGLSYREQSRPGGLSYRTHRNMKHPQLNYSTKNLAYSRKIWHNRNRRDIHGLIVSLSIGNPMSLNPNKMKKGGKS